MATINDAVHACLKQCYNARSPIITLAEFLDELRQNPEWHDVDIRAVESIVIRMLKRIVTKRPDAGQDDPAFEPSGLHAR